MFTCIWKPDICDITKVTDTSTSGQWMYTLSTLSIPHSSALANVEGAVEICVSEEVVWALADEGEVLITQKGTATVLKIKLETRCPKNTRKYSVSKVEYTWGSNETILSVPPKPDSKAGGREGGEGGRIWVGKTFHLSSKRPPKDNQQAQQSWPLISL